MIASLAVWFAVSALVAQDPASQKTPTVSPPTVAKVELKAGADGVEVTIGGEPFTTLRSNDPPNPVLYPLRAPGGVAVTRDWPLQDGADEPHDHAHHRSLWFAHGSVEGIDFWAGKGRIEPQGAPRLDAEHGCTLLTDRWLAPDGSVIASDERRYGFRGGATWRALDFDIAITGADRALRFGDTKEGCMALRLRPELCLRGERATAHGRDSAGHKDAEMWGKRADWIACTGKVGDAVVTVAMFDHPDNLRHPTWWHARDYGLWAANPFGKHDFEGGAAGGGDYTLPKGETLRLRYCVLLAAGELDDAAIGKACEEWLRTVASR